MPSQQPARSSPAKHPGRPRTARRVLADQRCGSCKHVVRRGAILRERSRRASTATSIATCLRMRIATGPDDAAAGTQYCATSSRPPHRPPRRSGSATSTGTAASSSQGRRPTTAREYGVGAVTGAQRTVPRSHHRPLPTRGRHRATSMTGVAPIPAVSGQNQSPPTDARDPRCGVSRLNHALHMISVARARGDKSPASTSADASPKDATTRSTTLRRGYLVPTPLRGSVDRHRPRTTWRRPGRIRPRDVDAIVRRVVGVDGVHADQSRLAESTELHIPTERVGEGPPHEQPQVPAGCLEARSLPQVTSSLKGRSGAHTLTGSPTGNLLDLPVAARG